MVGEHGDGPHRDAAIGRAGRRSVDTGDRERARGFVVEDPVLVGVPHGAGNGRQKRHRRAGPHERRRRDDLERRGVHVDRAPADRRGAVGVLCAHPQLVRARGERQRGGGPVGLVRPVAVEVERDAGRCSIGVTRNRRDGHRLSGLGHARCEHEPDARREVLGVHLHARGQLGGRAGVVGDARGGRVATDDRVGVAVFGVGGLTRPERVRVVVDAVAVNVELDQGHVPVGVFTADEHLRRRGVVRGWRDEPQPTAGPRVRRVRFERACLYGDPSVGVGRAHHDRVGTGGEHGRDRRAGALERAVRVEIPGERDAATGARRAEHHRRPGARGRGPHDHRRGRPARVAPPLRRHGRVAHDRAIARRRARWDPDGDEQRDRGGERGEADPHRRRP